MTDNTKEQKFLELYHDNNPLDWLFQNRKVVEKLLQEFADQQNKELLSELSKQKEEIEALKKDFYSKLLKKLQLIESGQLKLSDYFFEVQDKVNLSTPTPEPSEEREGRERCEHYWVPIGEPNMSPVECKKCGERRD